MYTRVGDGWKTYRNTFLCRGKIVNYEELYQCQCFDG